MDIKGATAIFVPDSCARTSSVQVLDPSTTATYYGPGEIVVTDESGTVLTDVTAIKSVEYIKILQRSLVGVPYREVTIKGSDIIGYVGMNYVAPAPLVHAITFDDSVESMTDHTFSLIIDSDQDFCYGQSQKVIVSYGVTAAETKDQIADGFVNAINTQMGTSVKSKTTFGITAVKVANGGDPQVIMTAFDRNPPRDINWEYNPQRFTVINRFFTGTVEDNKTGDLSYDAGGATALQCNYGLGSYWEVGTVERKGRGFSEPNYQRVANTSYGVSLNYDAKEFESDGTTANRYDTLTIVYNPTLNGLVNQSQQGTVKIFMPVENNATSQINGLDTSSLVKVLNKYIVTENGVGKAFVPTT